MRHILMTRVKHAGSSSQSLLNYFAVAAIFSVVVACSPSSDKAATSALISDEVDPSVELTLPSHDIRKK